jgi:hypothetical protein
MVWLGVGPQPTLVKAVSDHEGDPARRQSMNYPRVLGVLDPFEVQVHRRYSGQSRGRHALTHRSETKLLRLLRPTRLR